MPCGATSNGNYPDYLKSILKKIAVGKDDDLRACACSLRSPLTTAGCLAIGGDGKIGAFPFCTEESANSKYALWPLEKAMETYWKVRSWNFTGGGVIRTYNYPEDGQNTDSPFSTSVYGITSVDIDYNPNTEQSNLVCGSSFYINYWGEYGDGTIGEIGFSQGKKVGDSYDSSIAGYVIGPNGYGFGFDSNRDGGATNGNCSILGVSVPMNGDFAFRDEGEYEEEAISSYGTLTPASYWPTLGSNLG
jgi:hypothetical protein